MPVQSVPSLVPNSWNCARLLLLLSILFVSLSCAQHAFSGEARTSAQLAAKSSFPVFTKFQTVEGIYEPSAAEQMPDGRFFVVEDEFETSLAIMTLQADGTFKVDRLDPREAMASVALGSPDEIPEDIEGIAVDDDGFVYIITSHSRETDGKTYPRREMLVRFKVDGNKLTEMSAYTDLKKDIAAKHPLLAKSVEVVDVKEEGGFNIEGIAFDADEKKLLVGFRSPLDDGKAVLVSIENPAAVFAKGEKASIGDDMITLDLKNGGVRGIAYDPTLKGYLIISGPVDRDRTVNFNFWLWSGKSGDMPKAVAIPGPPEALNRGECVSPVVWEGEQLLFLMRDDGKKKKERYANYIFLRYDQLEIHN